MPEPTEGGAAQPARKGVRGFFQPATFITHGGCAAAVILVVNVTYDVFEWRAKWFGLLLSLVITVCVYLWSHAEKFAEAREGKPRRWIPFAILNGFLVYATAFGVNTAVVESKPPDPAQVFREGVKAGRKARSDDINALWRSNRFFELTDRNAFRGA